MHHVRSILGALPLVRQMREQPATWDLSQDWGRTISAKDECRKQAEINFRRGYWDGVYEVLRDLGCDIGDYFDSEYGKKIDAWKDAELVNGTGRPDPPPSIDPNSIKRIRASIRKKSPNA